MNAVDTRPAGGASRTPLTIGSLVKFWAAGTGIAILLVSAAYLIADAVSGPLVVTDIGEVTLGNVLGFTFLGATIGAALAYVVGRLARRPRLTFIAMTIIALVGYAVVPFSAAESTWTATWLNIFHLVVATPVIGILIRYLPENRTSNEA